MRVLITGATHGMGLGVARDLARRPDVEVVVLGRSEARCQQVCDELAALGSSDRVSYVRCDLARLTEVRAAIGDLRARGGGLDAVFINAGLGYAPERRETEDGYLEHFQVNYLAQFMLLLHLLELLEASPHGGRVVFNVTEVGELDLDDLQMRQGWTFEKAIGAAMVAKHMFGARLHQLYEARSGPAVSAIGFQIPKTVWTNQLAIIPWHMRAMATVAKWFGSFITIDQCGEMIAPLLIEGADESRARSGHFLTFEAGSYRDVGKNPASSDPEDWRRLWDLSLDLCADDATRACAARLEAGG